MSGWATPYGLPRMVTSDGLLPSQPRLARSNRRTRRACRLDRSRPRHGFSAANKKEPGVSRAEEPWRLLGCAAAFTNLGNVLNGFDLDRLLGRIVCLSHATAATAASFARGRRTRSARDLHLVANVLAQLRSVSCQLKGIAVVVSQTVVPIGTT